MQDQVKLSLRLALGVVLQGIRIRIGRSLVTLTGVVLGIAFLMASLTGQAIKEAVHDEDRLRMEVNRMMSFLAAEIGPPVGQSIGLVQMGPLSQIESRLLTHLAGGGLAEFRWYRTSSAWSMPELSIKTIAVSDVSAVGEGVASVLLIGEGPPPAAFQDPGEITHLFSQARDKVLTMARSGVEIAESPGVSVVTLAREMTPEEVTSAAADARTAGFRRTWIIIISILVTVVGITNAMLMSVTERFREIGTMKCLGALSSFIRNVFFIESALIGVVGGVGGALSGAVFSIIAYGLTYGFGAVLASLPAGSVLMDAVAAVAAGIALSVIAAIYPAHMASMMLPANALRTNV